MYTYNINNNYYLQWLIGQIPPGYTVEPFPLDGNAPAVPPQV